MSETPKILIPLNDDSTVAPGYAWSLMANRIEGCLLGSVNLTIVNADFVVSDGQSRFAILVLVGTPSGPQDVVLPSGTDHSRPHIIHNKTGQVMTVKTDDGGSVGVALGPSVVLVYSDGLEIFLVNSSEAPGVETITPFILDQDDLDVGNYGTIRISTSIPGGVNVTGLNGGAAGRELHIFNVGTENLTFMHQDSGSVTTNRIWTPAGASKVLLPNAGATFEYDAVISRWLIRSFAS